MPYLSEIRDRKVLGPSGDEIAKLIDVAIIPSDRFPPVQWAVLATRNGEHAVRWADLTSEVGHYRVRVPLDELVKAGLPDDALRLARDLMDKQIVDTHGAKVVRVNDLQLEEAGGQLRLVGADVGLRGLLRRVGGEAVAEGVAGIFGRSLPRGIIPWHLVQPIDTGDAKVRLTVPHAKLALLHPADIADIVEDMSAEERLAVFEQLDVETAAEALAEVDPEMQVEIVGDLDEERAADILEEMAPDEAADLLQDLPEQQREDLVELMEKDEGEDVEQLLAHPEDSAGGIMTTDFVLALEHETTQEAVEYIRRQMDKPDLVYYVYVVDDPDNQGLVGVVSLRDILLAQPEDRLRDYMRRDPRTIHPDEKAAEAARVMTEYNLLALPVTDQAGRMLGLVTADDALDVLLPESLKRHVPRIFS